MAANAAYGQTISSTPTTIFQSAKAGGSQIDGATAITVSNNGATKVYLNVSGLHASGEYFELNAGSSVTFRRMNSPSRPSLQLDTITANTLSGTTTLAWGVTEAY